MALKYEMLRVFRTVAEKGSLASAGDALGRTPSAVSMMLAQLEDEIGAPLFETDRKNRLTPLGRHVLEESSRVTQSFERGVDAIHRHASSLAGTVRIVAIPSATFAVLPRVIEAFRAERPDVRLEISDVDSREARHRIMADEADIAIISAAPDTTEGIAIFEDELGIACLRGGPIAQAVAAGRPVSWGMLELEPFISNPLCALVQHPSLSASLSQSGIEARNTTALLSFVGAGLGATVLPRSAIWPHSDRLEFYVPQDPPVLRRLHKLAGARRRFSPAVEAFWEAL